MLKNTEPPSAGAGSVPGDQLRDMKQLVARFECYRHCPAVLADRRTDFSLPLLDRFPLFSAIVRERPFIVIQVPPKTAEIDQTWPLFPLPSSAVALFQLPATINQTRVYPQHLATTKNAETRDLGLKIRGAELRVQGSLRRIGSGARRAGTRETPCATAHVFSPRSRVSAFRLRRKVKGPSVFCRLSYILQERDRGRMARKRWPTFCALRRFAANLKSNHRQ